MSEIAATLGSTDEEPLPILLGGHQAGEHRADVIPIFPVPERVAGSNRLQAMSAAIIARANRPNGVNAPTMLLFRARTTRQLDELRFGGSQSDTLKG